MGIQTPLLVLCLIACCCTNEVSHEYTDGEDVMLWFNSIGSNANLVETHSYYSLPFCHGPKTASVGYHDSISGQLLGIVPEFSGMDIRFKVNLVKSPLCSRPLNTADARLFEKSIAADFWYQLILDDLTWELPVGIVENAITSIFLHRQITILYNTNRIIAFNTSVGNPVEVKPDSNLEFTYEVIWAPTNVLFADRHYLAKHTDSFQHKIHWFSIINSFVMVLFMMFFVYLILSRVLKQDIAFYNKDREFADLEQDLIDECGWKQIRGDVFRNPSYPMHLSILIGSGFHIALTVLLCILITILAELYTERTSMLSAFLFLYATTTPVNGFFGGSKYLRWKGTKWIKQCILSTFFFPSIVFAIQLLINILASYCSSTRSVPFSSAVSMLAILCFVMLPLNIMGTIVGRAISGEFTPLCRINPVPRPIPEKKWYLSPWSLAILGGLLPAGSAFIEVYFIFTSFWSYRFYYVFDFILLVFIMLILVTMLSSVICTYFLVNAEDYRWHWMSFCSGASISLYLYSFALYYFLFKTHMTGMFQTTFYFAYTFVFCALVGLLCGTSAYTGASIFVHRIYGSIKAD